MSLGRIFSFQLRFLFNLYKGLNGKRNQTQPKRNQFATGVAKCWKKRN